MDKLIRTDLAVDAERTMLVSVESPGSDLDRFDPLAELRSLAKTAGAEIVDEIFTKRRNIDPAYYIGSGKAEEIAMRVKANEVSTIIFNNELSPAQIREIEKIVKCKVLDRTELILDIFASRASSRQASLQVELAQLQYTYPRLRHMWSHLERIAGGQAAIGGIGTRGPGEKQIEVDRRLVRKRETELKRELRTIDRRKLRTVKSRSGIFTICLVGYTNAGKSTLMNLLTGAGVLAEDKLFATLETRTRKWELANGVNALLSDTVGFVSNLPHMLVASFRATLEEAIHADLLLHVADASHHRVDHQIESVNKVLEELDCGDKPQILLLNKTDKIVDPAVLIGLQAQYPDSMAVSAMSANGIEILAEKIQSKMHGSRVTLKLRVDFRNGKLMQYLAKHAEQSGHEWGSTTVDLEAEMTTGHADGLGKFKDDVEILDLTQQ